MRALEAEVVDATWAAIEPLLPPPPPHPLGCHRPRVPDRVCFWGLLIRSPPVARGGATAGARHEPYPLNPLCAYLSLVTA